MSISLLAFFMIILCVWYLNLYSHSNIICLWQARTSHQYYIRLFLCSRSMTSEVGVCFLDIVGIADHHCLNSLSMAHHIKPYHQ